MKSDSENTSIATAGEKIYEWDRQPRMPVPPPPRGSCDCQFHIYDDPARFPPRPNPPYPPIESATFSEAQRMHKAIGFDRGVIVHSAIYGSDHRLLLHALEGLDDPGHYRGIGIVDDGVSDLRMRSTREDRSDWNDWNALNGWNYWNGFRTHLNVCRTRDEAIWSTQFDNREE